ncbi:hypothetical protein HDU96_000333 [Phlyctochytrium bullatum]|nr:hypothetical protein HDU96_000333 [Phlyctochytrium bullatum]
MNPNQRDYYQDPEVDSLINRDAVRDDWEMSRMSSRTNLDPRGMRAGDDDTTAYNVPLDEIKTPMSEKDSHPGERNDSESLRRLSLGSNPDEIYESLDIVAKSDDPELPALTFRSWTIGLFFCIILAAVNTTFSFRTNSFAVSPYIAVILSYPMGIAMAKTLPEKTVNVFGWRFSLNPGPFNQKEHTLIFVFASTGAIPVYALYNIIGQKYTLKQNLNTGWALCFAFVTQCFGYALAGLCRRYLVRPAVMIWPSNLSTVALLNSLSLKREDDKDPYSMSRFRFFWICVMGMSLYSFLPSFVAPMLGAVSLLCYIAPNNNRVKLFGSATQGLGMLSLSFDWSIITTMQPITTPLWALLNQAFGLYLVLWIVIPILFSTNAFGNDMELGSRENLTFYLGGALNTPSLFMNNGTPIAAQNLLQMTNTSNGIRYELNRTLFEEIAPVRISTYFAVEYCTHFIVFTAALTHVALWHGKDIVKRFRSSVKDLDPNDVHAQMMDKYPDVPDLWYIILLVINVTLGILACEIGGFDLPWWGVILAFVLAGLSMIPIGTIQAISGQHIGLNVMSEFIIGLILPGRFVSVVSFKTLSYMAMSQGLVLVKDLKLGHYMKVPPRSMFIVQLTSSILAMCVNIFVSYYIYDHLGAQFGGASGWTAVGYKVFFNAGAIWGAVGPARFFGPGSPYFSLLLGFIVGAIAPVIFWGLYKRFGGFWKYVNVPVIAVFPSQVGSTRSDLITPFVIGYLVNYVLKRKRPEWWRKFALVMSAGFDTGVAITVAVVFLALTMPGRLMPWWLMKRFDQELIETEEAIVNLVRKPTMRKWFNPTPGSSGSGATPHSSKHSTGYAATDGSSDSKLASSSSTPFRRFTIDMGSFPVVTGSNEVQKSGMSGVQDGATNRERRRSFNVQRLRGPGLSSASQTGASVEARKNHLFPLLDPRQWWSSSTTKASTTSGAQRRWERKTSWVGSDTSSTSVPLASPRITTTSQPISPSDGTVLLNESGVPILEFLPRDADRWDTYSDVGSPFMSREPSTFEGRENPLLHDEEADSARGRTVAWASALTLVNPGPEQEMASNGGVLFRAWMDGVTLGDDVCKDMELSDEDEERDLCCVRRPAYSFPFSADGIAIQDNSNTDSGMSSPKGTPDEKPRGFPFSLFYSAPSTSASVTTSKAGEVPTANSSPSIPAAPVPSEARSDPAPTPAAEPTTASIKPDGIRKSATISSVPPEDTYYVDPNRKGKKVRPPHSGVVLPAYEGDPTGATVRSPGSGILVGLIGNGAGEVDVMPRTRKVAEKLMRGIQRMLFKGGVGGSAGIGSGSGRKPPEHVRKVVIIAIHGWFPQKWLHPVTGPPQGTSPRLAFYANKAVRRFFRDRFGRDLNDADVTTIALEKEGMIEERARAHLAQILQGPPGGGNAGSATGNGNQAANAGMGDVALAPPDLDPHALDMLNLADDTVEDSAPQSDAGGASTQAPASATSASDTQSSWVRALREADLVLVVSHSQGVPVSVLLADLLIREGLLEPALNQRVCVLTMAGIWHGPFPSLQAVVRYVDTPTGNELFDLCNTESRLSRALVESLARSLSRGVRCVLVSSWFDEVVPLYSSSAIALDHPNLFRAIFIDEAFSASWGGTETARQPSTEKSSTFPTSDTEAPSPPSSPPTPPPGPSAGATSDDVDFLTHLVVFSLKLRNRGLSDHGLGLYLSRLIAGTFLGSTKGHSSLYDEVETYM